MAGRETKPKIISQLKYGDEILKPWSDDSYVYIPMIGFNSEAGYMKINKNILHADNPEPDKDLDELKKLLRDDKTTINQLVKWFVEEYKRTE